MNILITGRGTSGSWQIRGVQLGAAIGATVEPNASKVKGYQVAVVVKRPRPDLLHRLSSVGVPIVWDIVDSWPQPAGNEWSRDECMVWLREQVRWIKPAGIVAATRQMALDCEEFAVPVLALPHHARPGQVINPIRERVKLVGYEGGEQYLGRWRAMLEAECGRRDWWFAVNVAKLAELDIVVAVREAKGYAARHWKSGVKLANAQGSGTPVVCNRSAGYMETASGGEQWADDETEMRAALDALASLEARREAVAKFIAPQMDEIANTYKTWLLSKF